MPGWAGEMRPASATTASASRRDKDDARELPVQGDLRRRRGHASPGPLGRARRRDRLRALRSRTRPGLRAPVDRNRVHPGDRPGLGADPGFLHSEITGGIDWRTSPGYSRTGGYYGLTLHRFADPDNTFSFNRLDASVVQHIPVLNETWVLSVRGRMQTTLDDDDVVPYFLMPSLGGGSVLRGYSTGRFRDRHALITSAEWRWFPNRTAFDVAFFFDAGTVAARRADLWSERMRTDWGIGGRFHGPAQTPLRVEVAHGSDGWKLVVSGQTRVLIADDPRTPRVHRRTSRAPRCWRCCCRRASCSLHRARPVSGAGSSLLRRRPAARGT